MSATLRKIVYPLCAVLAAVAVVFCVTATIYAAPATAQAPDQIVRIAGRVTALADPDFTVHTFSGRNVTVHTTGGTAWHNLGGFGELEVGMAVGVAGVLEGNGTINARAVAARAPLMRVAGVVTATGDHSLTVHTPANRTVSVTWGNFTRCVIRGIGDNADSSACSRIQTGDHVVARGQFNGTTFEAIHIAVWVPAR